MKTHPLKQGIVFATTDSVGGSIVMARAIEIASADGRLAIDLLKTDWEQAKRELSGEDN